MAFTGGTIWETENSGDDANNGGGFDTGVAGFPTDGAATSATGNSPVFTSATYNFVSPGDVGHWIYIKSGTNWTPGFYQIASVASNAATLTAGIGTAPIVTGTNAACGSMNTVAGCATTASPTGATWGIDYSQKSSAQFSSSTFAIDGTTNTKLTDGTNTIGKNWVGNIISITSGTGFTVQRVAVVSTSGTAATVDKSLGTLGSTSGVGKLGGAFANPGPMAALMTVNGMLGFVKYNATPYSFTSATTNIANGPPAMSNVTNAMIGYSSSRFFGNMDTQPIFQINVTTCRAFNGAGWYVNITCDGNSQTSSQGASVGSGGGLIYCTIKNCTTVSNNAAYIACLATANSAAQLGAVNSGGGCFYCEAYANTATPFVFSVAGPAVNCLSYSNTGATTDGFQNNGDLWGVYVNCISYGNGRDGFRGGNPSGIYINCHAESNTGIGFNNATRGLVLINCSAISNSGGNGFSSEFLTYNSVVPAATVFVAAGSNNFALNNITSQGALLRASAYAGYVKNLFPRGLTTMLQDIGAAQSRVPWQTTNLEGGISG